MNRGLNPQAFTIVEVMIFLAVSALMMVAAFAMFSGQTQKTQFTQAINDIQAQLNDVINNVSTGYYSNTNNFQCRAPIAAESGPQITALANANNQGTNGGCVYIGRAVHFNVGGNKKLYNTYNLVGLQYVTGSTSTIPISLTQSFPVAIAPSASAAHLSVPPGQVSQTLSYGLQAIAMHFNGTSNSTAALAIISSFGQNDSTGKLASGSKVASLYAINPAVPISISTGTTSPAMADYLDSSTNYTLASSVIICYLGKGGQYGVITIGSSGRQLNNTLAVFNNIGSVLPSGACVP